MRQCVIAVTEVESVHPHGLFAHSSLVGVSGRLVVIRKGNVARQSPESRTGMDLGVGEGIPRLVHHIVREHGNVGRLGFPGINVFDQGVPTGALPKEKPLPTLDCIHLLQKPAGRVRCNLPECPRVEEGSKHPPRLRGNPDLSEGGLPDDACLNVDPTTPLGLSEKFQSVESILRGQCPQPGPVQEEASGRMLLRHGSGMERLQSSGRLDELLDRLCIAVNTDNGCGGHVLHNSYRVSLWRLRRTDVTPLRVVEFAGSNELPRFLNRRGDAAEV